jgi:hypothetical protein
MCVYILYLCVYILYVHNRIGISYIYMCITESESLISISTREGCTYIHTHIHTGVRAHTNTHTHTHTHTHTGGRRRRGR